MSQIIIFIATGMLAYWLARGCLLALGNESDITAKLQEDAWTMQRVAIAIRTMLLGVSNLREL